MRNTTNDLCQDSEILFYLDRKGRRLPYRAPSSDLYYSLRGAMSLGHFVSCVSSQLESQEPFLAPIPVYTDTEETRLLSLTAVNQH